MLPFGNLFHFYCIAAATAAVVAYTTGFNDGCPTACECYLDFVTCIRKQLTEIPQHISPTTKVL